MALTKVRGAGLGTLSGDTTTVTLEDTSSHSANTGPAISFKSKDSGGTTREVAKVIGESHSGTNEGNLALQTRNGGTLETKWKLFKNGNFIPSNADYGIILGATATGDSNLLNDYEKGTINISSLSYETSGGLTTHSGNQALNYTKVGRLVHINGNIHVNDANANGNQNGRLQIPLPFANPSGNEFRAVGQAGHYSHNGSAVWLIEGGGSVATFRFAYLWNTPTISDNDTIVVNITYQTS